MQKSTSRSLKDHGFSFVVCCARFQLIVNLHFEVSHRKTWPAICLHGYGHDTTVPDIGGFTGMACRATPVPKGAIGVDVVSMDKL